jgi:hypothetical protein
MLQFLVEDDFYKLKGIVSRDWGGLLMVLWKDKKP